MSENFTRLAGQWQELADEQQKAEAKASRLSLLERFRGRRVRSAIE
jgi:hypothetical protein